MFKGGGRAFNYRTKFFSFGSNLIITIIIIIIIIIMINLIKFKL